MNNKLIKAIGILAGILGSVLLVSVAVLMMNGSKISEIFDVSGLFTRATTTASAEPTVPTVTEPVKTTDAPSAAETTLSNNSTEVISTTEEPPALKTVLRVGVSSLKGNFNPFEDLSEGDADVMKLVGINLLTRDRTGKVIMMATEGEFSYYNNERYLYTGPADITVGYDSEHDETTYTLKLRDGIYFSDGVKLTVDDLIFNLYVRLQPNFSGSGNLRSYDIVGLKNYYYNNSMAESIIVTDEEVSEAIANEDEEIADFIRNLIRETLENEKEECKKIWSSYAAIGYGNTVEGFFFNLYGLDLSYNLVGKALDEVCEDVIASYGLDYRLLGEHYAVNASYFDKKVGDYAHEILLYKKMTEAEHEPVDYISGIVRLGDYTVKLRMHGYNSDAIYQIFDMVIAPMHYYGNPDEYNYEQHRFGFPRGNYTIPENALKNPLGAGPFIFLDYDGQTVSLTKNSRYYKETSDIDTLTLQVYGDDVLDKVSQDQLDIVVLNGTRSVYNALCGTNSNHCLTGNKLYAEEIFDLGYSYLGMNADNVKVGDDPMSEASVALRTALLTSVSVFRDLAYGEYFGDSVHIIDYPASPFFGLAPEGKEYTKAFSTDLDGNELFEANADSLARYNGCIEAVKGYLLKAGFTFNENTGRFTEAPAGASRRYSVRVCGDQNDEHPSYGTLAYAKSVLYQLGIDLEIRYVNSIEDMLVSLYLGEADMWCASWNCIGDPNFDLHYRSDSNSNLFRIRDEELDGWIDEYRELAQSEDQKAAKEKALQIMQRVREWAVELPCYTLVDYLVYNVNTINVSTLPTGHSLFWSWMDDVAFLDVYPQEQKGN